MKNLVTFFEIPATDFDCAVRFYESVLGIKLSVMDCETEKNGKCPRSISWTKDFNPSNDGVLISLQVEEMEAAIAAIEKSGGKVTRPKTKIEAEGMSYFAVFIDSEENRVGL